MLCTNWATKTLINRTVYTTVNKSPLVLSHFWNGKKISKSLIVPRAYICSLEINRFSNRFYQRLLSSLFNLLHSKQPLLSNLFSFKSPKTNSATNASKVCMFAFSQRRFSVFKLKPNCFYSNESIFECYICEQKRKRVKGSFFSKEQD